MDYGNCSIDGCKSLITDDGELCHYHRSITDRTCAYRYHKIFNEITPVDYCSKKKERIIELNCQECEEKLDPVLGIEIIENNLGLNQGE